MPSKNIVKEYKENSYYHIYNRGVAKGEVFLEDEDYKVFISYLKIYLSPLALQEETLKVPPSRRLKNYSENIKLNAYCLMPNHFHLLIHQTDANAINFFMRSLGIKYAMYFNRKYKRVGTLFQAAYKAVMINDENHLLYLTKYIHRNPSTSRRDLEGYKYSSYGNYLGLFQQDWLKPLDFINKSYKDFVEEIDMEKDFYYTKGLILEED